MNRGILKQTPDLLSCEGRAQRKGTTLAPTLSNHDMRSQQSQAICLRHQRAPERCTLMTQ